MLGRMKKIRIALIENHNLTRVGLRAALHQCREIELVGEAANGTEGLKLLEESRPDIGIVDIDLPDISGIELTKKFKESQRVTKVQQTRIVVLTWIESKEAILATFAAGVDSYCRKDISFELLLEALRITQAGNAWIDPAITRVVIDHAQTNLSKNEGLTKTVTINAVGREYRQIIAANPLTDRELTVLQLIVEGNSNNEIARKLVITVGTAKTHVRSILYKLCADDRTTAAVRALRCGLIK